MPKPDIKLKFSKRLRNLRESYGYTQEKLAELSGIEYKHIQRLEGKFPCDIRLTSLTKLADAFKIPLSKLIDFG